MAKAGAENTLGERRRSLPRWHWRHIHPEYGSHKHALSSAIILQPLAMRPVHGYNMNTSGCVPQVVVLSKLAMSDQRQ
jgi:hypothetical protein